MGPIPDRATEFLLAILAVQRMSDTVCEAGHLSVAVRLVHDGDRARRTALCAPYHVEPKGVSVNDAERGAAGERHQRAIVLRIGNDSTSIRGARKHEGYRGGYARDRQGAIVPGNYGDMI